MDALRAGPAGTPGAVNGLTKGAHLIPDKELLDRALKKFRTKRNLAKYLGVTPQSVSNYGTQYPIPKHVRRILEMELGIASSSTDNGDDEDVGLSADAPWRQEGWQKRREITKVHEQVQRLHNRTRGEGPQWAAVINLLDLVEGWAERDWRLLHDERREWVVAYRQQDTEGNHEG